MVVNLRAAHGVQAGEGDCGHACGGEAGGVGGIGAQLGLHGIAPQLCLILDGVQGVLAGGAAAVLVADGHAGHVEVDIEDVVLHILLMGLAVLAGSHEADFLSAAPYELHGPAGALFLEVVHQLHDGDGTGAVVPDAGGIGYGIVMSGECDDLVLQIGALDGSDHVVGGALGLLGVQHDLHLFGLGEHQLLGLGNVDAQAGQGIVLAESVGGTQLVLDALVLVQVAADGDVAQRALFRQLLIQVGLAAALHQHDLALNVAQVLIHCVLNILEAADNALGGGGLGLADADYGIRMVFGLQHFQSCGLDGRNVDLKILDNGLNAGFFTFGLQNFGGLQLRVGACHANKTYIAEQLPCSFLAHTHCNILLNKFV